MFFRALTCACIAAGIAAPVHAQSSDTGFAGVQHRGAEVMGVDPYASWHLFEDLADGGRIVFAMRDTLDAAGTTTIRVHLRAIVRQFTAGDFSSPDRVHARVVPGSAVMAERRAQIRYVMRERRGGGEIRIVTSDSAALAAVREFLAFQRSDHRASGGGAVPDHSTHDHSTHPAGTR